LPKADAWTTSLLTNPEVIAVDQHSSGNHPAISTDKTVVWMAKSGTTDGNYLAAFNLSESSETLHYSWNELGLSGAKYQLRDLWERKDLGASDSMGVTLPPHGSVLYGVSVTQ
jgi:alpha-galactosidase